MKNCVYAIWHPHKETTWRWFLELFCSVVWDVGHWFPPHERPLKGREEGEEVDSSAELCCDLIFYKYKSASSILSVCFDNFLIVVMQFERQKLEYTIMQFEKWTRYSAQNLEISEILHIRGLRNILLILSESFWNLWNPLESSECSGTQRTRNRACDNNFIENEFTLFFSVTRCQLGFYFRIYFMAETFRCMLAIF